MAAAIRLSREARNEESRAQKAIVAIARQMAVDLWRWRTGKVKAEDLGWVMIGANR